MWQRIPSVHKDASDFGTTDDGDIFFKDDDNTADETATLDDDVGGDDVGERIFWHTADVFEDDDKVLFVPNSPEFLSREEQGKLRMLLLYST